MTCNCLIKICFRRLSPAFVLAAVLLAPRLSAAAGITTWSGAGSDLTWTNIANWTTTGGSTPPATGDSVVFGNGTAPATTNSSTGVNVIVNTNITVATLSFYNTNSQYENLQVPAGSTLTVSGAVNVGTNFNGGANGFATTATLSGAGNFTANGSTATFSVGGAVGAPLKITATLTLPNGTNTIANSLLSIGESISQNGATSTLNLGTGTNLINVSTVNLGSGKSSGTLQFSGAGGGVSIRNTAGTGRATLTLGNGTSASGASTGQLLLAGHPANVLAGTVTIAAGTDTGAQIGKVTFDTGIFDATTVLLGAASGTGAGGSSTGTFTVGGSATPNAATLIVGSSGGGSFVIGDGVPNGTTPERPATGIFNLNPNAIAQIYCSLTKAPPTDNETNTGTININGGTLILEAAADTIGTGVVPIDNLNLTNATLHLNLNGSLSETNIVVNSISTNGVNTVVIDSVLSVAGSMTIPLISYTGSDPYGSLVLGAMPSGYTGALVDNAAAKRIDLLVSSSTPTLVWVGATNSVLISSWDKVTTNWSGGSAYADPDNVRFDDTASNNAVLLTATVSPASFVVTNNVLNYTFGGSGSISGSATLAKTGAGTLTLTETGGDNFSGGIAVNGGTLIIDNNSSTVTGGLTISGGTVQLGNNDAGSQLPGGAVTLAGGSLILDVSNNVTVNNIIGGSAAGSALVQANTNVVTLAGVNAYSGTTLVNNGGTIKVTTFASLGALPGGAVTVTNGSILDLSGLVTNNEAGGFVNKQFYVAGAGGQGNGVIVNNGTNQQDAFSAVTLTANATFGGTNRFDLRVGTPALNLGGFTLTKTGANQISVVGGSITGGSGGAIVISNGDFSVQDNPTGTTGTTNTVMVYSPGIFGTYGANPGSFTWPITLYGGTIRNDNHASTIDSAITLMGNSTLDCGGSLSTVLNGSIADAGGNYGLSLTNTVGGIGSFTLAGTNTFHGGISISARSGSTNTLALGAAGSISNAAFVNITTGGILDVSAIPVYNANNALDAAGTGTGSTAAVIKGGTTVNLGAQPVTLTYDSSDPALYISQGALSLNGNAFTVNTTGGSPLVHGNNYILIQQASGNIAATGNFTANGTAVGTGYTGIISVSGGNVNLTVDRPPVAGAAAYSHPAGAALKIAVTNLLAAYASDPDGDPLTLAGVDSTSTNGVSVTTDANYIYYDYTGSSTTPDSFHYLVSDGYLISSNVVTVTVTNLTGIAPNINTPAIDPATGNPTFSGHGIPGYNFGVESETSLSGPWSNAGTSADTSTVTVNPDGSWNFTNSTPVTGSIFFRLYYPYSTTTPPQ